MADKNEINYDDFSLAHYMEDFFDDENMKKRQEAISTGFQDLDKELGGGFTAGLIVLGAISSSGKSTLMLQIAENIASVEDNPPVLYFSMEMSGEIISAKALSRQIFRQLNKKTFKPSRGVSAKNLSLIHSSEELPEINGNGIKEQYNEALAEAERLNKKLYIIDTAYTADAITEFARKFNKEFNKDNNNKDNNKSPVIIIDYLQILSPGGASENSSSNSSMRLGIDSMIQKFRTLSSELETPVIIISSLNRSSYTGRVRQESFKESGSIEYSADVLIGMDFQKNISSCEYDGITDKASKLAKYLADEKNKNPRKVTLTIIKQRYGATNENAVNLDYYAASDFFCPSDKQTDSLSEKGTELVEKAYENADNNEEMAQLLNNKSEAMQQN